MKKYLTALVIATTATTAHAIDISTCEKYGEPGPRGDWIVKCDATEELTQIVAGDATAMFLSVDMGPDTFNPIKQDLEHFYINVVPNGCGPDTTGYRIFKHTDSEYKDGDMYAIPLCE